MRDNSLVVRGVISLNSLLFVVFLVLKFTKVINWSWWWVTAPLWIPFCMCLLIVIISIFVGILNNKTDDL